MKRIFKILAWLVIIHSTLFILFWGTNSGFHSDTNDFLATLIGARVDYIFYCLLFSIGLFFWSVLRLIYHRDAGNSSGLCRRASDWIFSILGVLLLVFFYGSFFMLFKEAPIQKIRLFQMLNYFRVILDPLLLLASAVLAAALIRRKRLGLKQAAPILIMLVVLWSLALAFPPISVVRGTLPEKPLLIAHRGASALAPENTLADARLAADMGAFGQEADLQMSTDGQLFLMHDDTLARTTDVELVFPQRVKDRADTFPELAAGYAGEPIPSFQEWLAVIQQSDQTFLYDVKSTSENPEVQAEVYEAALHAIAEAVVADQAWILAAPDQVGLVISILPEAKLVVGTEGEEIPTGSDLVDDGYQVVNAEYTLPVNGIHDYHAAGLWINIYTADEAWQYSRLWVLGVDSTTTNQLTVLMALKKPLFSMPYIIYALLLVIVGVIAIGMNRILDRSAKRD
jgi:glycerophosphoryl diester phosphodiesterase